MSTLECLSVFLKHFQCYFIYIKERNCGRSGITVLASDQFWSSTSFVHICFKMFIADFRFIFTFLEMSVHSGLSMRQVSGKIFTFGPRQANLVLIAYASSEGSGEPAHPRSLARTSAAPSYKQ